MAYEKRVALAGSHREAVAGAAPLRPVDNNDVISVTMVLRRRARIESPESFAFSSADAVAHHSREEFGMAHGGLAADIAAIEAFAHEYGLTVTQSSQARRSVVLSGTAENMQQAFGVSLHHFSSQHGAYRGRTGPVMIPEELQPVVMAVLGLDNRPVAKPHLRMHGLEPHAAQPAGSLSPVQVAKLYNFPANLSGAGQTIAIVELLSLIHI